MGTHARYLGAGALIVAVGLLLQACPSDTYIPPRFRPVDAGTPADCKVACEHLRDLKCPEGEPDEEGTSCEAFCEHVEKSGTVTLKPACVAEIKACPEIEKCSY